MVREADIRQLLEAINGIRADSVASKDELLRDLNIWGDDAADFIEKYAEAYKVDMSEFRFRDHFPVEGSIWLWWKKKFRDIYRDYEPITIDKLVTVANNGKWTSRDGNADHECSRK